MLAQALIATKTAKVRRGSGRAAATPRSRASRKRPDAYAQLAMAYGRKGDLAHADLASAQAAFTRGDIKTARQLAARAKTRLPVGSPAWVRADDIVNVKLPKPPTELIVMTRITPMTSRPRRLPPLLRRAAGHRRAACAGRARENSRPPSAARSRQIVHDYLIAHPEVLQEAMAELRSGRPRPKPKSTRAAVKEHAQALFSSPRSGHARQSAGQRHLRRVLRLQLRLLQARHEPTCSR